MSVVLGDIGPDGVLQRPCRAEPASPELAGGEQGEPALHQVQPGSRCRCEMQLHARVAHQPAVYQRGLVDAGVVQHQVQLQLGRRSLLDGVEQAVVSPAAI